MDLHKFKVVAIISLFLAVFPLGYTYYELLRIFICGLSAWIAYLYYEKNTSWYWVFVGVAILFNPIIPVHMDKGAWIIINIITALIFIKDSLNYKNNIFNLELKNKLKYLIKALKLFLLVILVILFNLISLELTTLFRNNKIEPDSIKDATIKMSDSLTNYADNLKNVREQEEVDEFKKGAELAKLNVSETGDTEYGFWEAGKRAFKTEVSEGVEGIVRFEADLISGDVDAETLSSVFTGTVSILDALPAFVIGGALGYDPQKESYQSLLRQEQLKEGNNRTFLEKTGEYLQIKEGDSTNTKAFKNSALDIIFIISLAFVILSMA